MPFHSGGRSTSDKKLGTYIRLDDIVDDTPKTTVKDVLTEIKNRVPEVATDPFAVRWSLYHTMKSFRDLDAARAKSKQS